MQVPIDVSAESDDALLRRYSAGERHAARLLTERLLPRVYVTAVRLLSDRAEAEDVAQEAMLRLWQIAPDWESGRAQVSTWLFRVVSNLCVDRLRKRGRVEPTDNPPDVADDAPGAEAILLDTARRKALAGALAKLPERQRLAVEMRLIEGFSNPEIAAELDISVEAVESLTARGKRALATALASQREALGYET